MMIADPQLEIDGSFMCREMPVEAIGTLAGHAWYFRARFDYWEFSVSSDPSIPADSVYSAEQGFYRRNDAPVHNAGSMPLADAVKIIHRCAIEFRDERSKSARTG